ncbi:hypothetical protein COHA_000868 [Chlorella ohadii]|uniref:von Hippel-Lindau disease tumour suppressor beta domain-containing protein n=1 Tax=Chlorella ohadii TaxID=2649997 RepID=A0AAD5E084_9CHLO|nr:hypothetical protein COHA_000868 [Chlorella ohadii]
MESPRPEQLLAPAPAGPPSCSPVPTRLAEAPERAIWRRKRKAAEVEEVQLGASKCSRVALASTGHAEEGSLASLEFCNSSSRPVRMLWINYDGHEVPYTILQPGESKVYRTFAQHAWQARCLESARRMCINGSQAVVAAPAGAEQARAVITDPPLLGWHETTHAAFPQPFRQQAASLLLCWQRLASGSQVRHIIVQLAPSGLWQEGRAAAHPDIPPVQLHSRSGFRQLVRSTHKATGQALPPRSRLSVLEIMPRQAPPPPQAEQWPRSPLAALNRLMNGLFGPGAAAE